MDERTTQNELGPETDDASRRLARTLYLTFVALRDVGFTESQALSIVVGVASGAGDVPSPSA